MSAVPLTRQQKIGSALLGAGAFALLSTPEVNKLVNGLVKSVLGSTATSGGALKYSGTILHSLLFFAVMYYILGFEQDIMPSV